MSLLRNIVEGQARESVPLDWRGERKLITEMRASGDESPRTWIEKVSHEQSLAHMIILAGKEQIVGQHDTPVRHVFSVESNTLPSDAIKIAQNDIDFWTIWTHGFDGSGAVLQSPAKLFIDQAKERGYNAGAILVSTKGADGSAKDYGSDVEDPFREFQVGQQLDLALKTHRDLIGDKVPAAMVGHSMGANEVFQYLKRNAGPARKYSKMIGGIVTPVIAGPGYKGPKPSWLSEIGMKDLDKALAEHVSILRDLNSNLMKVGVLAGLVVGEANREAVLLEAEKKIGLVSNLVKGYVGEGAYDLETILGVHVDEYIHNYPAIRRHIRMLRGMSLLAGDETVGRAGLGGLAPMMIVAAEGDKTLRPELMLEWAKAMGLPEWGTSVNNRSVLLRDKVSGHYPNKATWENVSEWMLNQILQ